VRAEGGGLGALRGLARFGGGSLQDRLLYSGGLSHLNVRHGVDGFDAYRNSSAHGSLLYQFTPTASLSGRIFKADSFRLLNDSPSVLAELEGNLPAAGPIRGVALPRSQQLLAEAGQPFAAGNATYMPDANDPDNQRGSFFFAGLLTFTQRLSPAASYRIAYQGVKTRREFFDGPGGIIFEPEFNNASRFDGRIDVVQARADVDAGAQLFSLGYEFERETYDSPSSDENPILALRLNNSFGVKKRSHTIFAQDHIRLIEGRLQHSFSGRVQNFRLSNPEFFGGPSPY
jgi:iron complex outermembrane receptor protein